MSRNDRRGRSMIFPSVVSLSPAIAMLFTGLYLHWSPRKDRSGQARATIGALAASILAMRLWLGPRLATLDSFSSARFAQWLILVVSVSLLLIQIVRLARDVAPMRARPSGVFFLGTLGVLSIASRDLMLFFVLFELASLLIVRLGRRQARDYLRLSPGFVATLVGLCWMVWSGGDSSLTSMASSLSASSPGGVSSSLGLVVFVVGVALHMFALLGVIWRPPISDLLDAAWATIVTWALVLGLCIPLTLWLGSFESVLMPLFRWLGLGCMVWSGADSLRRYDVRGWALAVSRHQLGWIFLALSSGVLGWRGLGFLGASSAGAIVGLSMALGPEMPVRGSARSVFHLEARALFAVSVLSLSVVPMGAGLIAAVELSRALLLAQPSIGLVVAIPAATAMAYSSLRLVFRELSELQPQTRRWALSAIGMSRLVILGLLLVAGLWPEFFLRAAARAAADVF